jgi:hypothetical protein
MDTSEIMLGDIYAHYVQIFTQQEVIKPIKGDIKGIKAPTHFKIELQISCTHKRQAHHKHLKVRVTTMHFPILRTNEEPIKVKTQENRPRRRCLMPSPQAK